MDDFGQQINQILSDPQAMKQIQGLMGSLGLNGDTGSSVGQSNPPPAPSPPTGGTGGLDPSALAGMLGALGNFKGTDTAPNASAAGPNFNGVTPEMMQMAAKMAPLFSQVNREDDSTRLLHALRPLLSQSRQKKLDEAIKILQMMRLLPLLKESGIFSSLLTGLV